MRRLCPCHHFNVKLLCIIEHINKTRINKSTPSDIQKLRTFIVLCVITVTVLNNCIELELHETYGYNPIRSSNQWGNLSLLQV